jgi:outer membrane protein assembly factor BamB
MKNSYASETPITDGQRVYVYLGYVGLFAYDMNGALAWAKPMAARNTGNDGFFYGGGASPALHDGRLYVVNDNEEESFIAAFDARTGAELWRRVRDERSNWSTPFV